MKELSFHSKCFNLLTPSQLVRKSFGVAFPLQKGEKGVNEFSGTYLLIYSLLSLKNQQTLGVSDSKIAKTKKNICWLEGYKAKKNPFRTLLGHINREDTLPE